MHIHIENDLSWPAPLQLSAERLRARLDREAGLPAGISISENGDPARMPAAIAGADVLFACGKPNLRRARSAAPDLRWVQVTTAGVEGLVADLPPDLILTNASGVHGDKGAEFILAAALMLNFGIPGFVTDKEQRAWRPRYGGTVAGKTATLLGVGAIGTAAAAALQSRGVAVIGVTRSGTSNADLDRCVAVSALDTVLPQTDILVSSLPLTPETRGLIDRRRLGLLPEGAGVIVVGRAAVFDYDALADALADGRLGGAVLDVFPQEPLPAESRLWSCPRLIMTPHCSLDDHAVYLDGCLDIFVDNLRRFCAGEPLVNVVEAARGY